MCPGFETLAAPVDTLDDLLRGARPCITTWFRLATHDPKRLVAIIRTGELRIGMLTHAAEQLGHAPTELAEPILLELLQHPEALVREVAVYGASHHPTRSIVEAVRRNAEHDLSEGAQQAAEELIQEWKEQGVLPGGAP